MQRNTQAHPPSENQQLEDARIAMEQAIVRITELERQLASYRKQYGALTEERRALCDILSADSTTIAGQTLVEAMRAIFAERDELTRLLAIVRKERDQYGAAVIRAAGDYAELERAARAVIDSTHFYRSLDGAPWIATGRAQIDALSRCVSPNSVAHEPAQSEETQTPEQAAAWDEERRLQKMAGIR